MAAQGAGRRIPQKAIREELDFTLGRSRGCIGRVRESAGALPTAGGRSRRPKGPPFKSPRWGRGFNVPYNLYHIERSPF